MKAPFAAARATQDRGLNAKGAVSHRAQAAADYGLAPYSHLGISPRGKGPGRPGAGLGGGMAIRKLSKLDAKEQDDVHEVTEDEDRLSPMLPPTTRQEPFAPQARGYHRT